MDIHTKVIKHECILRGRSEIVIITIVIMILKASDVDWSLGIVFVVILLP